MCTTTYRIYSCACRLPLTLLPIPCAHTEAKGHVVEEVLERVGYKCDPCWQKQREEEQARIFDLQGEADGDEDEDGDARDKEEEEMERIRRRRGRSVS